MHESEWKWVGGNIDHTIDNNRSLEDLKKKLTNCLTLSFGPDIIGESTKGVL
jgi:hypothetical protein